jgi:pyrroloquinoline quinone biosynthesis protein D
VSESPVTLDTVPALQRHFRFQWEPSVNAHVLLYPEGRIQLSGSAGEIMKRIDGTSSVQAIIETLEQAFPGVELRRDVLDFLEVAHERGWIISKPGNP